MHHKIKKLLSLCLAVVLLVGIFEQSSYAVFGRSNTENTEENSKISENTEESSEALEPEKSDGTIQKQEEKKTASGNTSGAESERTEEKEITGRTYTKNTDNSEQISTQEEEEKEVSPAVTAEFASDDRLLEEADASVSVLEEERLEKLSDTLTEYLAGQGKALEDVVLPLEISLTVDGQDKELKTTQVSIHAEDESMYDEDTLEDGESLVLCHLKEEESEDAEWEILDWETEEREDTKWMTFSTDSFSPFLLVKTVDSSVTDGKISTYEQVTKFTIDKYVVNLSGGASKVDGKYVWNPDNSASGHQFVYNLNYAVSCVGSVKKGMIQFEVPLHILKDRDGNWADSFDCPYMEESEVQEGDNPEFVYRIDEENNKVIISNYAELVSKGAQAGYIEIGYTTTKSTFDYRDMEPSDTLHTRITAGGSDGVPAVSKEADAAEVYIDTHATISYTQKRQPTYYTGWQNSWGEKPADADDYYYLVWPVYTKLTDHVTEPYELKLDDTFTDLEGSVVGYRFAGQQGFSAENTATDQRMDGYRYDYVLTRHKKNTADAKTEADGGYQVDNQITTSVTPADGKDPVTSASSSAVWGYEKPSYKKPTGHFGIEKYGLYNGGDYVSDSNNISDYTLGDFADGKKGSIEKLRYYVNMEGYPYPYTLKDGSTGNEDAAIAGDYGRKKVSYSFTDDYFELESEALNNGDYDLTAISWRPQMRTAVYDTESKNFKEQRITTYAPEDTVTIWVRTEADTWNPAAVYHMADKTYTDIDNTYVASAQDEDVTFQNGVKGVRFTCENAYYRTSIDLYPEVSLKSTTHTQSLVKDKEKVSLTNRAGMEVTQDGTQLYSDEAEAKDYIKKVQASASLSKGIMETRNDKRKRRYLVTWRLKQAETYRDNNGIQYIGQKSGVFYDLLPSGAGLDRSSVNVWAGYIGLNQGSYTIETIDNYKDTGRTMLIVRVSDPTEDYYEMTFQTVHPYNSIQDFGKNLLNSAAYETGNDTISNGYPDDGGRITERDLLSDLDPDTDAEKFLYAEARHDISILLSGNSGLSKLVKAEKDAEYKTETTVIQGENYSYQIRVANDKTTRTKDMVLFDSLENFYQKGTETSPIIPSDWKGSFVGVDTSDLSAKGIRPVIYLSAEDGLNLNNHNNLQETADDGSSIWVEYSEFLKDHKLEDVHAVAVDVSKKKDGTPFILEKGKSLVYTILMKAPEVDTTGKKDPLTYNNIYMSETFVTDAGEETWTDFIHQDYTKIHYRIAGDLSLKKVSTADESSPVRGATYLLRGTSDYGTEYKEYHTTGTTGRIFFEGIEKGKYELLETSCTDDWQLDTEVYPVTIDGTGKVTVMGLDLEDSGTAYLLKDSPRIHADLKIKKIDSISTEPLNGAEFLLTGTSDYGNDILMHGVSEGKNSAGTDTGILTFKNIELGTYQLTETKAKDGYITSRETWTVQVDERGVAVLRDQNGAEVKFDKKQYQITNEPLHSISFLKMSSYGEGTTIERAEFSLTGVSDYQTDVDKTAVSLKDGTVQFDGLEPGTYILKETKAPDGYEVNETAYPVTVNTDGSFTIQGLGKTTIGSSEIYCLKDDPTGGVVKLTKFWQDDGTDRPNKLDMNISTKKPSKNLNGYTLTFDANGGSYEDQTSVNEVVYSTAGTSVSGKYQIPTSDDGTFKEWTTDKAGHNPFTLDNNNNPETALTEDTTVYAQYEPAMKYAVAIYGIAVDEMETGESGLTFGPATGGDYVKTHKPAHTPTGTTSEGNPHRCVHNDSWTEIIEWNKKDPWVYEQCIEECCTKTVPLNQNTTTTIFNSKFDSSIETGDGPSILFEELRLKSDDGKKTSYENLRWHPNGGNVGSSKDGWGASRIRAMLNGADELTDTGTNNYPNRASDDINKSASVYTESNCLLAAFPKELQKAIGKRAVKYDTGINANSAELHTTYDKLWFFSPNEICNVNTTMENHPNETGNGGVYPRMKNVGDFAGANHSDLMDAKYCVTSDYGSWGTQRTTMWLRSIAWDPEECRVSCTWAWDFSYLYRGVAPCFTLAR